MCIIVRHVAPLACFVHVGAIIIQFLLVEDSYAKTTVSQMILLHPELANFRC